MTHRLVVIILISACLVPIARVSARQAGTTPIPVGGAVRPPVKTKDVPPVYPPEAQQARIAGVVILEAIIGEDGKVRSARVLRSIPQLDQAAIDAVRQWEYQPTLINGVAVPVVITVTVNFALQGNAAPPMSQLPPPLPNTLRLFANQGRDGPQVWDIDQARAAVLPRWNPDAEPPLAISDATRIARDWLSARNPNIERYVPVSANLVRRMLPRDVELSYYQISFSAIPVTPTTGPLMVVVLLDGSVLEPKTVTPSAIQTAPPSAPIPPGVTPPRAIREVRASYTPEALRQKISGSVFIEGTVGVDGTFQNLHVVRSLDALFGLDEAALKAASQWRFTPGMKDGQPVPVTVTVELTFSVR